MGIAGLNIFASKGGVKQNGGWGCPEMLGIAII